MIAMYARRLGMKLLSALIFLTLTIGWVCALSIIARATGLRARIQGADDLWVAAMTVGFLVLMVPISITHGRITKRIHSQHSADGSH